MWQVISENKTLLEDLRDGRNVKRFINHEMFDILFREDGKETDEGDLEISLIFVLIRWANFTFTSSLLEHKLKYITAGVGNLFG